MRQTPFENWFSPDNYMNLFAIGYAVAMFIIIFFFAFRHRGQIRVRIQTPLGETIKWVKPEPEGDKIILKKEKGKKPGWTVKFTNESLIICKDWLGRLFKTIEVFPDATEAIRKNYTLKTEEQPKWDKKTSKKFIEAEIIKKAGEPQEKGANTALWMLALLQIASTVFIILVATGRLRI